ncbi:MAG: Crp/Fnr family transcriptional regulator [Chromatocurvus sp.]
MLRTKNDQPDRVQPASNGEYLCMASHASSLPLSVKGSRVCCFDPGDILYREREDADSVYLIKQGLVKLISYMPNGRARIVRLHGGDSLVGLSSLYDPKYDHTAVAVGYVEAECIPVRSLMRIRSEDPSAYCCFLENWNSQMRVADTWITQFSTGSIRARVARLVNFLSEIEQTVPSTEVQLLTCEEMAAVLGVTPESVSRILAEFKRGHMLRCVQRNSTQRFERDVEALQVVALD